MSQNKDLPDTHADIAQLRKKLEDLKLDIEDILHDQNDINESTRAQLDAISTALAKLQADKARQKPRRKIGFVLGLGWGIFPDGKTVNIFKKSVTCDMSH